MKKQMKEWFKQGWLVVMAMVAFSCSDQFNQETQSSSKSSVSSQSNAELITATQEVLGITGSGMTSQGITYGRVAEGDHPEDDDLCGAVITKSIQLNNSAPDSLIISGSITIDFGDGAACSDSTEHDRSGKITTEFLIKANIKNHQFTSVETVTLDDFTRENKTLNGVFIAHAASGGMRSLDILNAELIFYPEQDDDNDDSADSVATTITWSGSYTIQLDNKGTATREDDTKTLNGSITGMINAESFTSEITSDVVFLMGCNHGRYPVSGTMEITLASLTTLLDFGAGTCDKDYTSTTAGVTTELNFK